ncbi:MAG: hypothetical protein HC882_05245 [Acidobacteria bacterium]|nr:hypothetical protein [Acidobacteriota bacterium]
MSDFSSNASNPPPPPGGGGDLIEPSAGKDPIMILIVAILVSGVAYFLIGQWQKAVAALIAWLVLLMVVMLTCGIGLVIYAPFVIAVAVDAYMQANELKQGRSIRQWTFFTQHA